MSTIVEVGRVGMYIKLEIGTNVNANNKTEGFVRAKERMLETAFCCEEGTYIHIFA